jgi:hypothetical protein
MQFLKMTSVFGLTLNFFCENIQNQKVYKSKKLMSKPGQKSHPRKTKKKEELKSETGGLFRNQELDNNNLDVKDGNELLMEKVCKKPRFWSSLQLPFARRTVIDHSALALT